MLTVTLISVGKNKEKWLEDAIQEYIRRLRTTLQLNCEWVKDNSQLETSLERHRAVLLLDPVGKSLDSPEFSALLERELEKGGARLAIAIGGAEGLPEQIRRRYPMLSLSKLTFTHQIARLILAEQIYRATEIWRGSPYHK